MEQQAKADLIKAIRTYMKKQEIAIVPDEAEIVRKVFSLYNEGWGYKKIANYLTENHIPTPRMKEKERVDVGTGLVEAAKQNELQGRKEV